MAIPRSQLEVWSHQGSVTQSKNTYATVKSALESPRALYADKKFEVFLQGSYGNDTNIYAESDVDIVIRLDSIFRSDLTLLSAEEKAAHHATFDNAVYTFKEFKEGVTLRLQTAFGSDVVPGDKAIKIKANGSRRSVDVVPCFQYRRYLRFNHARDELHVPGIIFPTISSGEIINYPKRHLENCTEKHKETGEKFKCAVRIFKNIRSKLVSDRVIEKGVAPSYFIEGLLHNVPPELFSGSYDDMVFKILEWLNKKTTDRTKFKCANGQYYLLRDNNPVCWPIANSEQFIDAVVYLWNNW